MTYVALEIGTSRFAATRVDPDEGLVEIHEIPVPDRAAWDRCSELLAEVVAGADVMGVGIASTGPIDMTAGVVAPSNVSDWQSGFAIVDAVQRMFPGASIEIALDGVALALAERYLGSTTEVPDALSIMVSERITGGVQVGGLTVVGRTGNGGHIGHVLVSGFDDVCDCGGRGCLEAVAGGKSAMRWARANGWSGNGVEDLLAGARDGHEVAVAAMTRAGTALGQAISSVTALLDIDLVVLSGSLAAPGSALWKPMNAAVATHARLSFLPGLRVVASELGENAILSGAGLLSLADQG
ncbi:ROK family protein [Nocardia cyriacigeorgica]|uniref:ROK family protein n=1 Tax=Nocardia cyriacigeorgica TaxID=135487 RepID=A0ABX0CCP4_9NOCA|nr:ROK family protein [Nocardia cyriacigeorgica]NEW40691.1 ROK family protein [Nocardia cyriacigeorgica]NEW51081.1 ROK family protein [Nocardia cyriacigeorgica]NEW54335.1 ROK family protein [Nocardia cyriacigeorgica]